MNKHKLLSILKQKLLGLVLLGCGILIPFVLDGGCNRKCLNYSYGLFTLFTKERFF